MVLVSAHFGVEPPGLSQVPADRVILDLTQDPSAPWATAKDYAFAFASLRKTLPVPDGGLAWSGTGRSLPGLSSVGREQVVLTQDMVLAMSLKNEYLNGADIDKSQYLDLAHRYEEEVAHLPDSAGTSLTSQLMQALPVDRWRATRGRNAEFLASLLASSSTLSAYPTPFGVELQLGTHEQRDACGLGSSGRVSTPPCCGTLIAILRHHKTSLGPTGCFISTRTTDMASRPRTGGERGACSRAAAAR